MNFYFHGLVLIPSDHCNIACRHCAPECGPSARHPWDVPLFRKVISEASRIPNLTRTVVFGGGEPFLYFPQMLELARHAKAEGFRCSVVTNGFWAVNAARAQSMLAALTEEGLSRVELSVDHFHQEFIPYSVVENALRLLHAAEVQVVMRITTTRTHTAADTIRNFAIEQLDGVEILGLGITATGRAMREVAPEEYYMSADAAFANCGSGSMLTVRPDGNVGPCCAGGESTPSLSLGNVRTAPLDLLVSRASTRLFLRTIVHEGPSALFEILNRRGLGHKIRAEYTSVCQACQELCRDHEVLEAVEREFPGLAEQVSGYFAASSPPLVSLSPNSPLPVYNHLQPFEDSIFE